MLDYPLLRLLTNRGVDAITVRQMCQHCEAGDGRNWRSWGGCPDDGSRLVNDGEDDGDADDNNSSGGSSGGGGASPSIGLHWQFNGGSYTGSVTLSPYGGTSSTAGSLLVMFVETSYGDHTDYTMPAGWVYLGSSSTLSGLGVPGNVNIAVYYYPAAPSQTSITFTVASLGGPNVDKAVAFEIVNGTAVDQWSSNLGGPGGLSNPVSSGTTSPTTQADEVVLALFYSFQDTGNVAPTPVTAGYVSASTQEGSMYGLNCFALATTSTGAQQCQVNIVSPQFFNAVIVACK
jgi:hypothetical protein